MPDGSAERKIIITMSLDLYIYSRRPVRHQGTGVFVRDNGQTRELKTIDEVQYHFPDADLLRKDFLKHYRRLGRDRFIEVLKWNKRASDKELQKIYKEIK